MKDKATTTLTVERLMNNGILVGQTGPQNNVIKLRPPMTFQIEHVDLVVQQLEKIHLSL
jgi:4-aminobutyrate aminotransferase-like enzyme